MRSTAVTLGAALLSSRERDKTYLCRVAYSLAEIVYRRVFRRMGSVMLLREGGGREEGPPAEGRGLDVCAGREAAVGPSRDDEAAAEAIIARWDGGSGWLR